MHVLATSWRIPLLLAALAWCRHRAPRHVHARWGSTRASLARARTGAVSLLISTFTCTFSNNSPRMSTICSAPLPKRVLILPQLLLTAARPHECGARAACRAPSTRSTVEGSARVSRWWLAGASAYSLGAAPAGWEGLLRCPCAGRLVPCAWRLVSGSEPPCLHGSFGRRAASSAHQPALRLVSPPSTHALLRRASLRRCGSSRRAAGSPAAAAGRQAG